MKPRFFPTPADFRAWLDEHHATKRELVVGFRKKATGKPSITWPQAVYWLLRCGALAKQRDNPSAASAASFARAGSDSARLSWNKRYDHRDNQGLIAWLIRSSSVLSRGCVVPSVR